MRVQGFGGQVAAFSFMIALSTGFGATEASAATRHHGVQSSARHTGYAVRGFSVARSGVRYGGGLQCVPFARENTGIELAGNAANWWSNAEGVYQRGARPEVGSVLNFRANGRMRMGHVAVVSNVVDGRNIEIDHANWAGPGAGRGGVSRNITVVDVSPNNDWSAVRVALGHTGDFGSVYPTYGFIYDRPDKGVMVANSAIAAPQLVLNAAPRDLRPARDRYESATSQEVEEVAEAADDVQPRVRRVSGRQALGSQALRGVHAAHGVHVTHGAHVTHGVHVTHVAVARGKSTSARSSVMKVQSPSATHSRHGAKRST